MSGERFDAESRNWADIIEVLGLKGLLSEIWFFGYFESDKSLMSFHDGMGAPWNIESFSLPEWFDVLTLSPNLQYFLNDQGHKGKLEIATYSERFIDKILFFCLILNGNILLILCDHGLWNLIFQWN